MGQNISRNTRFRNWLLETPSAEPEAAEITEEAARGHEHPWWKVMCLTGVDYYSTLGYLPAIAVAAAGSVAPIAALLIVVLTLAGMVPVYRRVATESPHGQGSVAMLETLLDFWKGKLFVLCLLGFVATAWFVTITLSAADATAHIVENPYVPDSIAHHPIIITVALLLALGVVFLKGFQEAISLAIGLVVVYLSLNLIVVGAGFLEIIHHPSLLNNWQHALFQGHTNSTTIIIAALLAFPQLALGLSGFETGVGMMPLIKGGGEDQAQRLADRIKNTRVMLLVAALVMAFYLLTTTFIATVLIPASAFQQGGKAQGRALAYLAHAQLGDLFGTIYDISTIAILWFAGASAMAGLLNIVPRYLPRYGMVPVYRRVATESPHGQGSVAMLETLLDFWKGKLFVLCLLGFVATAWFVTITLSAADATAHIVENPYVPDSIAHHPIIITVALLLALGVVFLKGFQEAISLAIGLVVVYLSLNLIVVGAGFLEIIHHPSLLNNWQHALFQGHTNSTTIIIAALLAFPQLALGLSGFETGVGMMPLIKGGGEDQAQRLADRIKNTRVMLLVAALVMAFYLLTTTFIATVLIPASAFQQGGKAQGRALAYLAHAQLGDLFGTIYDISTIAILWFAGASAMAGLLNIVPRYLPRYGMAPDWTRLVRPLVIFNIVITVVLTIFFKANVNAQASSYATGVLAMMFSAAIAVTLVSFKTGQKKSGALALLTALSLGYALVTNEISNPSGMIITCFFIGGIILASLISRIIRTTELRVKKVELDDLSKKFLLEADTDQNNEIMIIAYRPHQRSRKNDYNQKEREQRLIHHLTTSEQVLFLEIDVDDPSDFEDEVLNVSAYTIGPHRVLRAQSASVPNAIAAFLLHAQEITGKRPHCYFGWTEGNPIVHLIKYILFGEGDTAPVTREVLRQAEKDPQKRPAIHVGG